MGKRKKARQALERRVQLAEKARELGNAIDFYRRCCTLAERQWPGLDTTRVRIYVTTAGSLMAPYVPASGGLCMAKIELGRVHNTFIGDAYLGYHAEAGLLVIRLPDSVLPEMKA